MNYKIILVLQLNTYFLFLRILIVVNSNELFISDPDIDLNSSQLIESRGFRQQTHYVITEDGYILTIFRIINPFLKVSNNLYPIYLQHGYFTNSDAWLITSHGFVRNDGIYVEENDFINNCSSSDSIGRTLAFVLSSCGYDVWLGNIRGNKYSSHISLDQNIDMKYWNFTIDELSGYDLTAVIHYVLKATNSETIGYIGHSLGTTLMFQLLSSKPKYSKLIKPFIALAPYVFLSRMTSIMRFVGHLEPFLSSQAIPVLRFGPIVPIIGRYFCGNPRFTQICVLSTSLISGFDNPNVDIPQIPRVFSHIPDSTSSLTFGHSGQRINSGNFAYFDYGFKDNIKIYGQIKPPNYNLSAIDSKYIVLMSGLNDILCDPTDVESLRSQLTVDLYEDYVIADRLWTHTDFLWALNVAKYINGPILRILSHLIR